MIIKSITKYLQKQYVINHFKITPYEKVNIVDLIIDAPPNSFNISVLHANGVHYDKKIALLKASVELIERVVFISPLVGPIDFEDGNAYIKDIDGNLFPIELVSPYFAKSKEFNSKGHACHTDETTAELLAKNEYYENIVLNNLENYMGNVENISQYNKQDEDAYFPNKENAINFDFLSLRIHDCWFTAVWHRTAPGYILGSAYASTECQASEKALLEAISKQEIAEKNGLDLTIVSEKFLPSISAGRYQLFSGLKKPHIIKRYHNVLSNLNLFMYQAV